MEKIDYSPLSGANAAKISIDFGKNDVKEVLNLLGLKHSKIIFGFIIVAFAFWITSIFVLDPTSNIAYIGANILPGALFIGLFGLVFGAWVATRQKDKAWSVFARTNNWQILPGSSEVNEPASISNLGHKSKQSGIIKAIIDGRVIYVYASVYVKDRTDTSKEYVNTVLSTKLKKEVTNLLLTPTKNSNVSSGSFNSSLKLEGDFNKNFNVSMNKGAQVEALSVLTPDVMLKMTSLASKYSLEINGDTFSLIAPEDQRSEVALRKLFEAFMLISNEIDQNIH